MKFEFPKLYTDFAKYYDRLESQYRDYNHEAIWLRKILKEHGATNVVDVSCGTASHVYNLTEEQSLNLHATDASGEMVKVAQTKLRGKDVNLVQSDFLNSSFRKDAFDAAICMYWSIAGLDQSLTMRMFSETCSILRQNGVFIFDTENAEGIKEELLSVPFIDAYFPEKKGVIIRANFSTKIKEDLVDWHSYYLLETDDGSQIISDRMNLRFYSKSQIEELLERTGFSVKQVLSSGLKEYEKKSPTLYFVAEKK